MKMKRFSIVSLLLMLAALILVACGGAEPQTIIETVEVIVTVEVPAEAQLVAFKFMEGGETLDEVKSRGILNCGVSGTLPGFSFIEADGSISGFDADYCKAVAAAALGNAGTVEFRPTTAVERFPILQNGDIDVLIRNTTWTISRDTSRGLNFAPTTFYDGQGMAVLKDSGIETLDDLEGGTVCVGSGTTTEKNLADVFRSRGINYEAVVFDTGPETRAGYDSGRCDGWTTDKSGLVAGMTQLSDPTAHKILAETMSKEPLGPLVRHGDDNWFDIVKWTVNCTILAEDLGVNSGNVDDMLGADDPQILNMLGVEGDLGQALGLNNNFCFQVIKQVGNYAEIYDRNLGPDTPFDLPRGLNSQWTVGGLLYSPPFR